MGTLPVTGLRQSLAAFVMNVSPARRAAYEVLLRVFEQEAYADRVDRVDEHAVEAGRIWPQSRGSQLAGLVVGARDGERILDLCAAPGGKTAQLRGEVTAVELDPNRASELRQNLATLRATSVAVLEADGTHLPPELTGFDRAL